MSCISACVPCECSGSGVQNPQTVIRVADPLSLFESTKIADFVSGNGVRQFTGRSRVAGRGLDCFFSELTCTCQHCGEHSIQASAERRAFRLFLFKFVLGVVLSLLSRAVFVRLIMQWIVVICWVLAATMIACIGAVASRSCPCEIMGASCFSAWHDRHH